MSTWSTPYLTVTDATGQRVDWKLPNPLPFPAGACADETLRHPVDVGLPVGGTLKVRWRTPKHANPRSRSADTDDLQAIALACDVQRAARARGTGWLPDANGWPLHVRPEPAVHTPAPTVLVAPPETLAAPLVGDRAIVSPANATLVDIAAGRLPLGATVAQVVTAIRREREITWEGPHKVNMHNMLDFLEQILVYTEPYEDDVDADLPEVAAWMRARLALPGVEVGGSVHIALLLGPDLARAIEHRRYTDRRTELLNEQARKRHHDAWTRYEQAIARREQKTMGGHPPKRPDELVLRAPQVPVAARTEELFATGLGMVLGYAEQHGLLAGPNPWKAFTRRGATSTGYRRSEHLLPHQRNVPPVGAILDIADALAGLGPIDPATGRHVGHRFRAPILVGLLGPRPSEIDALGRGDYVPGERPRLLVAKSASTVNKLASQNGETFEIRDRLKKRTPGDARVLDMPRVIADAIDEHIACGYATDEHLFTGVEGGPLRWGNVVPTYWRYAVQKVLGRSGEAILRDMPRKWIRKSAVTWMLRSGLAVEQVAELTGHDPVQLFHHYAGFVAGYPDRHTWTGWDDAWTWASQEHHVD
jgi:hypothetical protein